MWLTWVVLFAVLFSFSFFLFLLWLSFSFFSGIGLFCFSGLRGRLLYANMIYQRTLACTLPVPAACISANKCCLLNCSNTEGIKEWGKSQCSGPGDKSPCSQNQSVGTRLLNTTQVVCTALEHTEPYHCLWRCVHSRWMVSGSHPCTAATEQKWWWKN